MPLALLWPGSGFAAPPIAQEVAHEQPSAPPVRLVASGIEPMFDTIGREEGLPGDVTTDVQADRHGFVWISDTRGVHRYDGRHLYSLERDPNRRDSLASPYIRALAHTREAIWIANDDGSLQRLDTNDERLTHVPLRVAEGATPKTIRWLGSDAYERIWMQTDLGLLRYDPRTGDVAAASIPEADMALLALAFSTDRRTLLVAAGDHRVHGVDVTAPSRVRTVVTIPDADSEPITALAADGAGLWMAAGKNLWRFETASRSVQKTELPVASLHATSMVIAPDGIVWLGSEYDLGLHRFDPRRRTLTIYTNRPEDRSSLRWNRMLALAIDKQDNLWIGFFGGGVSRLRIGHEAVTRYILPGSRARIVCAMQEVDGRQVMVALCGGSLVRLDLDTGQITDLSAQLDRALPEPSPALNAHVLLKDGRGGLWVPTGREGLLRWHPTEGAVRIPFRSEDGKSKLADPFMTGAYIDAHGRLWVAHNRGLAVLEPDGTFLRNVLIRDGAKPIEVGIGHDVTGGPDQSLWVSGNGGLIQYWPEQQRARRFRHDRDDPGSLSDNSVLHTYTDRLGQVWVGTRAGLNRLVTGSDGAVHFRRYGMAEGLPDMSVAVILNDAAGALWIGTARGVARWDPKLDRFESYLKADGVPDSAIGKSTAFLGRDGGLYFGSEGVWRLDPQRIGIAKPPPVLLSAYEAGDRKTVNLRGSELQSLKARYDDGRVTFVMAVLGDARRLSYRLVGLDDRWQDMPSELSVSYHRLAPGAYRFEVRQLDSRGGWRAPELSIPLDVSSPPWRQPWAYVLYALAAAGVVVLIARAYLVRRRRRIEHLRELQERDERLRISMQASGDVMIEIDLTHGRVVHMGESLLGHEIEKLPTRLDDYFAAIGALIHPDDVPIAKRLRDSLLARRAMDSEVEFRLRTPDASWAWVRLRGQLIERDGPGGRVELFTGMLHDITEDRQTRELRQKAHEAQLQAETKGRVLAMMSHEIRTPMSGVVGTIELLGRMPLGAAQQKVLETCKDSVSVLLSVVNDVLDFSKIESGKLQLERAPLSPRRMIESVASAFAAQAGKKGIELDLHVDPAVPARILGDRVRLHQVLTNLVGNAVKFTEHGGVSVNLAMDSSSRLRVLIADTGIGMDEATMQHLYQPFQQGDATTARRFGGTGLGLSIAKHLTELMGGQIHCASRPGEGTCFTVVMPVEAVPAPAPASLPLRGVRVLVLASRLRTPILREPLSQLGAEAVFVHAVAELTNGSSTPGEHPVDVVLIDRGEGARESQAAVRRHPSLSGCPILQIQAVGSTDTFAEQDVIAIEGNPLLRSELLRGFDVALGRPAAPAALGPGTDKPVAPEPSWPQLPGRRILLAEDDPTNREVITHQLHQLGCICDVVEDGEQAWGRFLASPGRYDLLVTDGYMPRLDGYELAGRIRQFEHDQKRPPLKILALTANADEGEEARCLAIGMDGYLAKPVRMDDLVKKLRELLHDAKADEMAALEQQAGERRIPASLGALAVLLKGDESKLARVLDIFIQSTRNDLAQLENAGKAMNRKAIADLAHRLKSACLQVGEESTWRSLDALESESRSDRVDEGAFRQQLQAAKADIEHTLARMEHYRAVPSQRVGAGEACP